MGNGPHSFPLQLLDLMHDTAKDLNEYSLEYNVSIMENTMEFLPILLKKTTFFFFFFLQSKLNHLMTVI